MFSLSDHLRMIPSSTPPPWDQGDGEFSFQVEVTFLAILISFLLSAVLIIITRTLSLAAWMSPGKFFIYDLSRNCFNSFADNWHICYLYWLFWTIKQRTKIYLDILLFSIIRCKKKKMECSCEKNFIGNLNGTTKLNPGTFSWLRIEQKANCEFTCTNLNVNTPLGGTDSVLFFGLVGCVTQSMASNK